MPTRQIKCGNALSREWVTDVALPTEGANVPAIVAHVDATVNRLLPADWTWVPDTPELIIPADADVPDNEAVEQLEALLAQTMDALDLTDPRWLLPRPVERHTESGAEIVVTAQSQPDGRTVAVQVEIDGAPVRDMTLEEVTAADLERIADEIAGQCREIVKTMHDRRAVATATPAADGIKVLVTVDSWDENATGPLGEAGCWVGSEEPWYSDVLPECSDEDLADLADQALRDTRPTVSIHDVYQDLTLPDLRALRDELAANGEPDADATIRDESRDVEQVIVGSDGEAMTNGAAIAEIDARIAHVGVRVMADRLDRVRPLAELRDWARELRDSGLLGEDEQTNTILPDRGPLAPWSIPDGATVIDDDGTNVTIELPSGEMARWINTEREWVAADE